MNDPADVTFRAGERIVLMDGCEVEDGGLFQVVIDASTDCF